MDRALATSAIASAPTKNEWNADHHCQRSGDDPDRKNEIDHDTDSHDCNDPHQSVTQGEAALHASAIGLSNLSSLPLDEVHGCCSARGRNQGTRTRHLKSEHS